MKNKLRWGKRVTDQGTEMMSKVHMKKKEMRELVYINRMRH